jgi:hypothetical protein
MNTTETLFPLGQIFTTPGAMETLTESAQSATECLTRQVRGDWGDASDEDKQEHNFSADKHLRIFSAYHTGKGLKLWVITEADRSATTLLLPDEY